MPSTKRTAYNGPPLSGPGIIWTASKLEATDKVPPELFKKWYETVHIPEIIAAKPGGVVTASRYQCMDPERAAPYLAIYSLPDLGYLQTPEFKSVSMSDPMLPEGGPVHKFVAFDTRFYQRVQVVERPGASKERAPILISAAIDPAEGTEQDFNEWYEKEHLQQLQDEAEDWRRTARYALVYRVENEDDPPEKRGAPKFLTLHEFEDGRMNVGEKVEPPVQQTEWTKKVMGGVKRADAAKFRLISTIGDREASW